MLRGFAHLPFKKAFGHSSELWYCVFPGKASGGYRPVFRLRGIAGGGAAHT